MKYDQLEHQINNCWKGKSIGATLGSFYQDMKQVGDLPASLDSHERIIPSCAIEQQLVWLHAFETYGPRGITRQRLAEYWVSYMRPTQAANTIGSVNLQAGISPALSGKHQNLWKHSNAAWTRAEIWACCTTGRPDLAAEYAYKDACIDHGDGEGVYAEMFIAALESAAFVKKSTETLIETTLLYLPPSAKVQQAVQYVLDGYRNGFGWKKIREEVVDKFEDTDLLFSPVNIAFVVIGLLYGENDFQRSIYTAICCGGDAVNTGAATGAILAIQKNEIPDNYDIEEAIHCKFITPDSKLHAPRTYSELTKRVITISAQVKLAFAHVDPTMKSEDVFVNDGKSSKLYVPKNIDREADTEFEFSHSTVQIRYTTGIDISPDQSISMELTVINQTEAPLAYEISYFLPEGCTILTAPMYLSVNIKTRLTDDRETIAVTIKTGDNVQPKNRGIIQMIAQGRPTTILIPFMFFGA